jgi:hypothetical protein
MSEDRFDFGNLKVYQESPNYTVNLSRLMILLHNQ